jgi:radical SAM superfamily enzyme YgiQ (UPF0313 family)
MDICLVTAPTATAFRDAEELNNEAVRSSASEPQVGILSLAAVLEARGDTPAIVDLNRAYLDYTALAGGADAGGFAEAAASLVTARDAEVCGFSSICSSYPLTIRIASAVKAMRPRTTVLLGGPQASVVDMSTLTAFPFVDLVLRGEAERTLPLLLDELESGRRLERVLGLSWRHGSEAHRNPNAPVIEDLDSLPSPAYHLTRELLGAKTAALELGRGCPFACTFCSTNDFFRRNFRLHSPERLLHDMRAIAAEYQISDFTLVHDMFTVNRRRVAAFCEAMIASREGFTWSCSARTDCIDDALLELMARGGCRSIFFGVETGSRRMQTIIDKHLDPERAEEIVDIAEKLGIRTTVSLIIGFPEETWEDVRDTIRIFMHSARCPLSNPQLNLLAPLAGTPIYLRHKQELVLEELCSDMSHQGRSQSENDRDLIRKYPEIFPNFYLLPVPHLDRDALFELHEFAMMAVERFRWLLSAIDQCAMSAFDFFLDWREHREGLRCGLKGSELRHYYRTFEFRVDFLSFVQLHSSGRHEAVDILVKFEEAMGAITMPSVHMMPLAQEVDEGSALWWSDIPVTKKSTRVIELSCDIQGVIDALKHRTSPTLVRGPCSYATREISAGECRLVKVSDWMACLLRACDGQRTIEDVLAQFSPNLTEVDESLHDYVVTRLLKGARAEGFISILRIPDAATSNQSRLAVGE